MSPWQKRARLGVAVFGIAFAIVVYAAIGERAKPAPPGPAPERLDPKAVIESSGNILQQVRGTKQDYLIKAAQQLTYEGGATKLIGVEIAVANRGGRDFVITAREAEAGERQQELHLTGDVKMKVSDGFEIATDRALFSESDGIVRAPAEFHFSRGLMTGTGVGMAYDKNDDVLSIVENTHVTLADEGGTTLTEFTSNSSIFTRPAHLLTLEGTVHVLHHEQVIDADRATAHLTDDDGLPTLIELRGGARVSGSGHGLDSMNARDIDLHYAADGQTIESVKLAGTAAIAMTGQHGGPGRQFFGDSLDIVLGADGALTSVKGRDNVRLDLAGATGSPARNIRARAIDADGEAGKGLTTLRFTNDVQYREDDTGDTRGRVACSQALQVSLADDAVDVAVFTGSVKFEEQGLQASGAQARYEPAKGQLGLSGQDAGGGPRVTDAQVTVDADTVDLTIQGRAISAKGAVKTTLRPRVPATGARTGSSGCSVGVSAGARASGPDAPRRLPGLLKQDQPANVNANELDYHGAAGKAIYTGSATLWQGETAIRADTITVDQGNGDLLAAGAARSTIVLDNDTSVGRGAEIRYVDAERTIAYVGAGPVDAQLSGPQGDLRASRIEIILAAAGGGAERLEAYTRVNLKVDARSLTGARLTYFAKDKRYLMSGAAAVPVKVVEGCRETSGKTLTFFKATDRIIMDGNEEIRTQTTGGGPCPEVHPR